MKLIQTALGEYGVKEISGRQDNPEVLKYFNIIGFDGSKLKDETAWCSAFVNWVAKISGYEHSGKLNARSWLSVGQHVGTTGDGFQLGDIAIFWRERPDSWKGHVAFPINQIGGWIFCLGGNQSNRVCIQAYPASRLLEYRRLRRMI